MRSNDPKVIRKNAAACVRRDRKDALERIKNNTPLKGWAQEQITKLDDVGPALNEILDHLAEGGTVKLWVHYCFHFATGRTRKLNVYELKGLCNGGYILGPSVLWTGGWAGECVFRTHVRSLITALDQTNGFYELV